MERKSSIKDIFNFFNTYLGWRNWAVLSYNSVAENIFVFFYIALVEKFDFALFIKDFLIFFLFSALCTSYGYLVNDLGDKKLDYLQGKDNTFKDDSYIKATLVVLMFLCSSVPFGLYFVRKEYFLVLWVVWLAISTSYSLKPVRLKERGKLGLLLVVLAQRVIPALLIFSAFGYFKNYDYILLTGYIFFRGLSSDINHQIVDYENDLKTSTRTYAVKSGNNKAKLLFRISLEFEKVLLLICLCIFYIRLNDIQLWNFPIIVLLPVAYLFLYLVNVLTLLSKKPSADGNPFVANNKNIFQFIHHSFPTIIVALFLLCMLVYENWHFVLLLIIFMLYRNLFSIKLIKESYIGRIVKSVCGKISRA